MNKQDFAVRLPKASLLVVSIKGVLYGFCDSHGETKDDMLRHLAEVRMCIEEGDHFYDMLWNNVRSQRELQAELDKATDAIRFEGEE